MRHLTHFATDDRGSVTLWNLFWLTGFCAILGLAVDITSAMNTKAKLQTVADASAHAGVVDIAPTKDLATVNAIQYAFDNMPKFANVVNETDVKLGWYDHDTGTFDTDNPKRYNAVEVFATRDTERRNATDTSFLAMVGLRAWDINAHAIAAAVDITKIRCRANGLFAGGTMEQTSNNTIVGPFCEYGDTAFKISQNNLIECGVVLMTPSAATYQNGTPPTPSSGPCNDNYAGLSGEEMINQSFSYDKLPIVADLEYQNAKAILTKYINNQPYNDPFGVIPPYITTHETMNINQFNQDSRKGSLVPGTLYNVSCAGTNKKLELTGFVQNVGIFTDCEISVDKDKDVSAVKPTKTESGSNKTNLCDPDDSSCENVDWLAEITEGAWSCSGAIAAGFEPYNTYLDTAGEGTYRDGTTDPTADVCGIEPGANGLWDNVMVFTSHLEGGNVSQKALTFPNNIQLGRIDGCTEGGGVRIYSAGSLETPSGTTMHGVQMVTLGDVQLSAKANGVMGINIQAMGSIKYTANGLMGGCSIDPAERSSEVVLTVRPIALVR